jgi:alanine racemase
MSERHGNAPPESDVASAVLTVDLDALAANYALLRREAGGAEVSAVVKADAYGLGIAPVAGRLAAEGCRTFFVATPHEGLALRAVLPQADIYILDGLFPGATALYAEARLRPVLNSMGELAEWREAAGAPLPAALHFDTGMNRLGISAEGAAQIAGDPSLTEGVEVSLIMSHLACADDGNHPQNGQQLARFHALVERLRSRFPKMRASLANTGGIFLGPDYQFDLVRPGIGLYGGTPFARRENPFHSVVSAHARVLSVRDVLPSEGVGYAASWKSGTPARLAVLAMGYADGYLRSLSFPPAEGMGGESGGRVYIGGEIAPVVGRISMDMTSVDITHLPEGAVKHGDMAELIGPNIPVDDVGLRAGTISYEILTALGARYMRRYKSSNGPDSATSRGKA